MAGQGNKKRKRTPSNRPKKGDRTPANDMQTAIEAWRKGVTRALRGKYK